MLLSVYIHTYDDILPQNTVYSNIRKTWGASAPPIPVYTLE